MELRYHHIGIPTTRPLPPEDYSETHRMYASGYFESPYGVEWMSFDPDCPLPELVKTVPHVAFVVDDLDAALEGKEILIEPNSPAEGVRVAFIVDHGAPIEFLQFDRPESEIWPHEAKFTIRGNGPDPGAAPSPSRRPEESAHPVPRPTEPDRATCLWQVAPPDSYLATCNWMSST